MRYTALYSTTSDDPAFARMSLRGQLAWFLLLSSKHGNMLGLFRLPAYYAAGDWHWSLKQVESALSECEKAGLIKRDGDVIWVVKFLKYNPVVGTSQDTGASRLELPETPLRLELADVVEGMNLPKTAAMLRSTESPSPSPIHYRNPGTDAQKTRKREGVPEGGIEGVPGGEGRGGYSAVTRDPGPMNREHVGTPTLQVSTYVSSESKTCAIFDENEENAIDETTSLAIVAPTTPARSNGRKPYPPEFEAFWESYPNKTGKDAAYRAWRSQQRNLPDTATLTEIIQAHRAGNAKWLAGYIPNPATWLNQGRWQDALAVERPPDPLMQALAEGR